MKRYHHAMVTDALDIQMWPALFEHSAQRSGTTNTKVPN
jgi:hypothetical protein